MRDEDWIRELANVNRERQGEEQGRLDERWDRLSGGELSPEEEAELRALAETSEEAREAWEAFRPLGPDFQASVVKAAAAELASAPESEPREPHPRLLPFRRAASRTKVWLGAAAALAAALLLFLRVPASLPPLPLYTAELSRGDQALRGETGPSTGLPVFSPGSVLTLDATPWQPVTGPVESRGFLADGEDLVPWEPKTKIEVVNGAVRLRGRLGEEILLPSGALTIWVVVSRPGKSPSASELQDVLRARRARRNDWQTLCDDVTATPLRHDQWQVACANLRVEDQPPS